MIMLNDFIFYGLVFCATFFYARLKPCQVLQGWFGVTAADFMAALLAVLLFVVIEQFIKLTFHKNIQRKVWVLILLLTMPVTTCSVKALLTTLLLFVYFLAIHQHFFKKKWSLWTCIIPSVPIPFLAIEYLPLMVFMNVFLFFRDREHAYLLFSSYVLPILFLKISYWEAGKPLMEPVFFENPIFRTADWQDAIYHLFQHSAVFLDQSIYLLFFVGLSFSTFVTKTESYGWHKAVLRSLLFFIPVYFAFFSRLNMEIPLYSLCFAGLMARYYQLYEPERFVAGKISRKIGLIILLLYIGLPFFNRSGLAGLF
jgi:hypothetical protein